jgi:hypothetical protein
MSPDCHGREEHVVFMIPDEDCCVAALPEKPITLSFLGEVSKTGTEDPREDGVLCVGFEVSRSSIVYVCCATSESLSFSINDGAGLAADGSIVGAKVAVPVLLVALPITGPCPSASARTVVTTSGL